MHGLTEDRCETCGETVERGLHVDPFTNGHHPFKPAPRPLEPTADDPHEYRVNLMTVIQMFADGVLPTGMQGVSHAIDALERAIGARAEADPMAIDYNAMLRDAEARAEAAERREAESVRREAEALRALEEARTAISDALGLHQTTHIHARLRALARTESTTEEASDDH